MLARRRLGVPPALAADAAAPARPGLLVARRRAAAARRSPSASSSRSSSRPALVRDLEERTSCAAARRARPLAVRDRASCSSGCCLLAEAIVGREVWQRRALARLPLAGARSSGSASADVAGDGLLHQLDDPHARPQRLGAGDDAGRAPPSSGSLRGKLQSRVVAARAAVRARRLGRGVPDPRAERVALRAVGVPAPHVGWTLVVGALFPLVACVPAASSGLQTRASRSSIVVIAVVLYSRPRRRAGLRPPLAARRGGAPVRRLLARRARRARVPGGGVGARDAARRPRRRSASGSSGSPARRSGSQFDQSVDVAPERDPRLRRAGAARLRADAPGPANLVRRAPRSPGCRAAPTPCAGARSRPTATSSRACSPSACARARRRATEAYGASGPTTTEHVVRWLYFLALALLIGGLGFRLLVLRGAAAGRGCERRFYRLTRARRASACSRSGSSPSCCVPRTRSSCRSATSSTATSRRSRRARASGRRSSR